MLKLILQTPAQFEAFLNNEEEMIKDLVDKVVASGANVLFCQKGIDDMAQHYLNKKQESWLIKELKIRYGKNQQSYRCSVCN